MKAHKQVGKCKIMVFASFEHELRINSKDGMQQMFSSDLGLRLIWVFGF
jgi:hypothetical protein